MHDLPEGFRARRIVPGKTYEYLAARRPILAAVPDGDARDLLAQDAGGDCSAVRPTSAAMADAIAAEMRREGPFRRSPRSSSLPFERPRLTARLADVFDDVSGVSLSPVRRPTAIAV